MNKFLANLNVLYVKLHNYHYNVVGKDFYATHVALEGQYDKFHNYIDEVAEQMKKDNKYPMASMKEYIETSTIKEVESKDYRSDEIWTDILGDYKELIANIEEIRQEDLSVSAEGILDDIQSELETQVWFIEATLK